MPNEIEERIQAALDAAFGEKIEQARHELTAELQSATAQLKSECAAELEAAVAQAKEQGALAKGEAVRTTARQLAETLAESGRRIRTKETVTDIAIELVETAKQFCGRCALFIQKGNGILGFRAQGFTDPQIVRTIQQLEIPLGKGSALSQAVATKERVEVGGGDNEVSPEIAALFGLNGDRRVVLIPVILRDRVLALLYADGGEQQVEVQTAALEVLTTITEAWLEAVGTRKKQPEVVHAR
jgi:hypothetical protein